MHPKPSPSRSSRAKPQPAAEPEVLSRIYSTMVDVVSELRTLAAQVADGRQQTAEVGARLEVLGRQVEDLESQLKAQGDTVMEMTKSYGRWMTLEKAVLIGCGGFLLGLVARADFSLFLRLFRMLAG